MSTLHTAATTPYTNEDYKGTPEKHDKITCLHCGKKYHQLAVHLASVHKTNIEEYQKAFPSAPTVSAYSSARISAAQSKKKTPTGKAIVANSEPKDAASIIAAVEASKKPASDSISELVDKDAVGMPLSVGLRPVADILEVGAMKNIQVYGDLGDLQCKVPLPDPNYSIDMEVLTLMLAAIQGYENTYIYGPTGSGKTAAVKAVCTLLNRPLERVNLNGNTTVEELIGEIRLETDTETGQAVTIFKHGIVADAAKHGKILLLDEVDAASPQVLFVLQRLLERAENPHELVKHGKPHCQIVVDGQVVDAHPDFRIICTGNTNGGGDMTGDYSGTNILNASFLNRFAIQIEVEYPDVDKWKGILAAKTAADSESIRWIVEIASRVNKGKDLNQCRAILSPRNTLSWARLVPVVGFELATKTSVVNALGKNNPDRQFVLDIIKNVIGKSVI